jgi:hypothetical protein
VGLKAGTTAELLARQDFPHLHESTTKRARKPHRR